MERKPLRRPTIVSRKEGCARSVLRTIGSSERSRVLVVVVTISRYPSIWIAAELMFSLPNLSSRRPRRSSGDAHRGKLPRINSNTNSELRSIATGYRLYSCLTQCFGDSKRPGNRRYERPRNVRRPMFRVPPKGQSAFAGMMIDDNVITWVHLSGGQEPRQWGHQVALNGPLQVPSSVLLVGSLFEQEPASFARESKLKRPRC